jgi:glutathione S-transferase
VWFDIMVFSSLPYLIVGWRRAGAGGLRIIVRADDQLGDAPQFPLVPARRPRRINEGSSMTLELYNFPASTCSQKVRLCLFEKGLDFTDTILNSSKGEHLTPEYLALNANGVVPTLVHDGIAIVESSVILEYLDEVFPEISMMPADPAGKAVLRKWLRFFEEVPTPAVRYPSFNMALGQKYENLSTAAFAAVADARPLRRDFYRQMGRDGFSDTEIEKSLSDIRMTAERMEVALGENGPWIMGEKFSIADCYVVPSFDRMDDLGFSGLWDGCPNMAAWLAAMKARPSYDKTYYPGTRLSDNYPNIRARA